MLDRIPITVSNEGDSTIAATTHYQLSDPSSVLPKDPTIHINENSYFFTTGTLIMAGGKIFKSGTSLFQAEVLFHELGHATGVLQRDSDSKSKNDQNTKSILDHCKKALARFSGTGSKNK